MTTGTKAIMAAAGGGGAAGEVLHPILTLSDASGSDKYYLSAVDTEGNISWSKEVGTSLSSSSDPYYFFPTSGRGDLTWLCEIGKVWWVMNSSNKRAWAIDVETGDASYYSSQLPNFTSNQYGASYGISAPVYYNNSGGTETLGWLQKTYTSGNGNRFQGYKFTNDRTTTPTLFGDFSAGSYGNQNLFNGGAMVNYDYNSTSGFHNWKYYQTTPQPEVYILWQEGNSNNSHKVRFQAAAIDQDNPVSVSNISTPIADGSNYSRGTAVRITSNLSMQKYFDENWNVWNGTTAMAAVTGDTGDSFGITSSNLSSQKPFAPTITSPYDYGTMIPINQQGNLTFDYEQSACVVSDGVKGMWGFIRTYYGAWNTVGYNLGYVETGTSYSSGSPTMNYESGGDGTDYSDIAYRATAKIYESSPSNVIELPNFSMRRINDNGYVGLWSPNYAVSNQRYEIRILDATNGQVGSTIEFDFSSDIANKPTKFTTLREDAVWTALYSGSNVS